MDEFCIWTMDEGDNIMTDSLRHGVVRNDRQLITMPCENDLSALAEWLRLQFSI